MKKRYLAVLIASVLFSTAAIPAMATERVETDSVPEGGTEETSGAEEADPVNPIDMDDTEDTAVPMTPGTLTALVIPGTPASR